MSMTPQQLVAEAKAQIKEIDMRPPPMHSARQCGEPAEFKWRAVRCIPRGLLEFKTDHPVLADKPVKSCCMQKRRTHHLAG